MKTIKITKEDNFVWKIVTAKQARIILSTSLFALYELHNDDSESEIQSAFDLEVAIHNGVKIGIEVGLI